MKAVTESIVAPGTGRYNDAHRLWHAAAWLIRSGDEHFPGVTPPLFPGSMALGKGRFFGQRGYSYDAPDGTMPVQPVWQKWFSSRGFRKATYVAPRPFVAI